ncbi:hypothetical protein [Spelaeicoccus albus]|uniref:DUF1579 domain-containing protein n=1 Tax=Spelaeicoccus albus TaxID=1280376 RepID=A0A7Z0D240_9MICO|nr:hypothetical protein [Spelaeicoccus albus]NYI67457.1 hypothetical protein [Spelaeicoccus albus]
MTTSPDDEGPDSLAAHRSALGRLSGFAGTWHGSGWTLTERGRAEFEQTEHVTYVLGGGLLTIEGTGTHPGAPDDVRFRAFAVVRFDADSGDLKWRAYSGGNSIEVPLESTDSGWRWGFEPAPGILMRFDITLDDSGWHEIGRMSMDGGRTWQPSLEMRLTRE